MDPEALDELVRRVRFIAEALDHDLEFLRGHVLAGLGAIPASDLQDAYGYCWGRWSQFLLNQLHQLRWSADVAQAAAEAWCETENTVSRATRDLGEGTSR